MMLLGMKKMTTMNDMFVAYQTHKGFAKQHNLEPIGFKEFTGIFIHFSSVFLQQSVAIYTAAKNSQLGKNQTKETIQ